MTMTRATGDPLLKNKFPGRSTNRRRSRVRRRRGFGRRLPGMRQESLIDIGAKPGPRKPLKVSSSDRPTHSSKPVQRKAIEDRVKPLQHHGTPSPMQAGARQSGKSMQVGVKQSGKPIRSLRPTRPTGRRKVKRQSFQGFRP